MSPLRAVWFTPRVAIRALVNDDPGRGVIVLAWLVGLGVFFFGLSAKTSEKFPLPFAGLLALAFGPLLNFVLVFVAALLTAGIGRMLGGRGTPIELRAALAWAQAPLLLCLVLWIPRSLDLGDVAASLDWVEVGLLLWSETLAIAMVAEVHGFSVFRSVLAVFLAWLVKLLLFVGFLVAVVPDRPTTEKPAATEEPAAQSLGIPGYRSDTA